MIEEIVSKISAATSVERDEVLRMIEDKQVELSGLISEEGAAYIVAKELGVFLKKETERLNIENIMPGMQNVDIVGKITRITPVREFKTEKAEGRVANITISDKTGSARLSLWNDEIEKLEGMQLGDVMRVQGYVREGLGMPEIRLGRKGTIEKTEAEGFDNVVETRKTGRSVISELSEGAYREVRAPLLQIFDSNIFFEVCGECKKRLKEEEDGFTCIEHGMVEPSFNMILSGIIDDSSGNIRAVFFGDAAEALIGITREEAKKLFDKKKKNEAILSRVPLGKDFIFEGRVRRNEFFDRLEFIVNKVKEIDIKKEIEMLVEKG